MPSILLSEAASNTAAFFSDWYSESSGTRRPSWFTKLPAVVQNFLWAPANASETTPGALGINIGGISKSAPASPVTSTTGYVTSTSTAAPVLTPESTPLQTSMPPSPLPTSPPTPSHVGATAGGVIGGLAGAMSMSVSLLLLRRRRRMQRKKDSENTGRGPTDPEVNTISEVEAKELPAKFARSRPLLELESHSNPGELSADEASPERSHDQS